MICLCLTAATLAENENFLKQYVIYCRLFELRVDRLNVAERPSVGTWSREMAKLYSLRGILTIRLPADGGSWSNGESQREALFLSALEDAGEGVFAHIDLEGNKPLAAVEAKARQLGVGIIRSAHDLVGLPVDASQDIKVAGRALAKQVASLRTEASVVPKFAGTCRGCRDLAVLLSAARVLKAEGRPFVILGMGEYGQSTRILASKIGSLWTYASPKPSDTAAAPAAPGQVDPQTLVELYDYYQIDAATRFFGVIGNPVAHSLSPAFHNPRLKAAGLNAVYLPFLVDEVDDFKIAAALLDVRGLSVTVPHKEAARAWASSEDEAVRSIGAANTLVREADGWHAYNSDVDGFFQPLASALSAVGQEIAGATAVVIGAGGAARAATFALLNAGCHVLIANRTLSRAEELAAWFRSQGFTEVSAEAQDQVSAAFARSAGSSGANKLLIIVNTTSVGMEHGPAAASDPLPSYQFAGREWVYDIVYAPPRTPFLIRAEQAGCPVLNGSAMFEAQAAAQSERFIAAAGR